MKYLKNIDLSESTKNKPEIEAALSSIEGQDLIALGGLKNPVKLPNTGRVYLLGLGCTNYIDKEDSELLQNNPKKYYNKTRFNNLTLNIEYHDSPEKAMEALWKYILLKNSPLGSIRKDYQEWINKNLHNFRGKKKTIEDIVGEYRNLKKNGRLLITNGSDVFSDKKWELMLDSLNKKDVSDPISGTFRFCIDFENNPIFKILYPGFTITMPKQIGFSIETVDITGIKKRNGRLVWQNIIIYRVGITKEEIPELEKKIINDLCKRIEKMGFVGKNDDDTKINIINLPGIKEVTIGLLKLPLNNDKKEYNRILSLFIAGVSKDATLITKVPRLFLEDTAKSIELNLKEVNGIKKSEEFGLF